MSGEELIQIESKIKELWEAGELPFLIHLCGGNEDELVQLFSEIKPEDYVCSTHRAHYHYLLKTGDEAGLLKAVKEGHSMFLFNRKFNFISSSIVAGNTCIAAGIAMALMKQGKPGRVWCFLGDGAEDEGHFYEAVRFVDGHKLPCTFIIEDNDRSVETPKALRYGNSFISWPDCVRSYTYTPTYPHAGSGCAHHIKFSPERIAEHVSRSGC